MPKFFSKISRFSTCEWKIPDGGSCKVGPMQPDCLSDHDVHFVGNDRNCSIKIDQGSI
jgi:hypothetical protein